MTTTPDNFWDAVWQNPAQWWDDQLELAGDEFAPTLKKAHDKIIAAGCLPVDLYTVLRRLQKEMCVPAKVWRGWSEDAHEVLENLWHMKAATDDFLTDQEFASGKEFLRKIISVADREENSRKGERDAGWHRLLAQSLDELLKRTGHVFPAAEFALLIRQATGRSVTAGSLRMLRSRRGQRLPAKIAPRQRG